MREIKVLLIIDSLASGGAQKQIVTLASGLAQLGYTVEVFNYHPQFTFFRFVLDDLNIPVHSYNKKEGGFSFGLILCIRDLLIKGKFAVVVSFLDTPNIYTELASIGIKNLKVIVSERNSFLMENSSLRSIVRRVIHLFSDIVVTNSRSQANWIKNKFPWLNKKLVIIYNGYDSRSYITTSPPKTSQKDLRLIGIGRIAIQKNQLNLIKAIDLFYQKHGWAPKVNWVGSLGASAETAYKDKVFNLLDQLVHVKAQWSWLGERSDVPQLLSEHHVLMLPSFFEGLPNVLCEAFFSARPAIASYVCDHSFLIGDNERGFTCDPNSPESICSAIERFISLSAVDQIKMGEGALKFARNNLSVDRMVADYIKIFHL